MPYFNSPHDGAQLYYADYHPSESVEAFQPAADREINVKKDIALVLLHGWPMSNRMWDRQILPLVESHGIRCVAPDRRGFGRSEWAGPRRCKDVTYDILAEDVATLLRSIKDLGDFIFVGSSMGCGESLLVQQKLHDGSLGGKCKGFIWLTPSLPYPLQTEDNPTAPSRELWDMILGGLRTDRHGFLKASVGNVFGTHAGVEMTDESQACFIRSIERNDIVATERCLQLISRYDFTKDLEWLAQNKAIGVPVVVVAGQDDNNWPPEAGPLRIASVIPDAEVQVWDKAAHGMYYTHAERVNSLILKMYGEQCCIDQRLSPCERT